MNDEDVSCLVGWREWLALPELGIPAIKAKVDTGARTSAIHTFSLETISENGRDYALFSVHPLQNKTDISFDCKAEIIDRRVVRDSGGHEEERYFINTLIRYAGKEWRSDFSLTNREGMLFRMLLGRNAIKSGGFVVDPARSYIAGRQLARSYKKGGP
ncbi:MAG: RimK/LysX family protein [Gammaproteobacteria bacterium]|nr:RimK/LysX family protein [Gammaproteobacteria bacterium]